MLTRLLLIIIALLILYLPVALSAPVCLSKRDARELWPKAHLYWYSSDHCWSNRRGPPKRIRIDPVINTIQAAAEEPAPPAPPPAKEDLWGNGIKPIRVIEIIRPSVPIPVVAVEEANLPLLPPPTPPPATHTPAILTVVGGAFSALMVSLLFFNRRKLNVKRPALWLYQRTISAGQKVSSFGPFARNLKSSFPPLDIREFIRRADRAGSNDHLAKVLNRLEDTGDPCDEFRPPDNSAIACWARRVRAQEA